MDTHHPWHRVPAPIAEQRLLREVEHRLLRQHQGDVPAGRIIRMVHGTARLLRTAGLGGKPLADKVEVACQAALAETSPTSS